MATSFTPQQDNYIRDNYLTTPIKTLGLQIGRSYTGVTGRLKAMGLVIPKEVREARKKLGQIKLGAVPPNKGKKQAEYMSAEAIEKTKVGRFKKGNLPHNCYNEVGKITLRKDNRNVAYQFICVAIGNWVALHTHVWEAVNGKLPNGYCLWFKDQNTLNTNLDNIECITRAENAKRNANHENPSDRRISFYIATTSRVVNKALQKELLNYPEIIEAKRTQLLLKRKIKAHGTK